MKRYYIISAVVLAMAMTACQKERGFSELPPVPENGIAFTVNNTFTKAGVQGEAVAASSGVEIKIDKPVNGEVLAFEETIEELNPIPATKGSPAYTSNVGTLYPSMGVYVEGQGDADFTVMESAMEYDHDKNDASKGLGWRYQHVYPGAAPWPDKTTPVDFYLSMPAGATGVTFTSRADKQITFNYTSPSTGAAQQDILFGQTSISKETHDGYLPNGAPVTMFHALTGIKFRNGHENNNPTKTIITKVKFSGLRSTGTCTVYPESTENIVEWEGLDNSTTFSQEFTNQAWSAEAGVDGTIGTNTGAAANWNSSLQGTSWTAAAADHNLNDADGSLTFWFIPQTIDENLTLEVTFFVKTKDTQNGTEVTHTINFGEQLAANNVEWKAGQLRTYTLKPRDVDVKIVDQMNGLTKSDLHVTNTGNVDEFVRMMVIGNWYGWETQEEWDAWKNATTDAEKAKHEPNIMVGYKYSGAEGETIAEGDTANTMIAPWFREDPVYGQYFDDSFKGGLPAAGRTDWVRGTGSYFYYTEKIGPGSSVGTTDSGTSPLFVSYTLPADKIPTIYIPIPTSNVRVPAAGVHLKMEVVVQAIGTTKPDGTEYADCWEAWTAAIGKTIQPK